MYLYVYIYIYWLFGVTRQNYSLTHKENGQVASTAQSAVYAAWRSCHIS